VDEGGGLERVIGGFGPHAVIGELAEFIVDQREELGGGFVVTGIDGAENLTGVPTTFLVGWWSWRVAPGIRKKFGVR
jgi:hypothetical protein